MSKKRILILGGTSEAVKIAKKLCEEGNKVVTSLAGRTKNPIMPEGEVRIGGFGGVTGLAKYIKEYKIDVVVDATHPFAQKISQNAEEAVRLTGVELDRKVRKPWKKQPGDEWVEVNSVQEAVKKIPDDARVMLAIGSQYTKPFEQVNKVNKVNKKCKLVVRQINSPKTKIKNAKYILSKPLNVDDETKLLTKHKITHLVCRNSGGSTSYAKIEAARNLNISVIIIKHPQDAEQEI